MVYGIKQYTTAIIISGMELKSSDESKELKTINLSNER